MLPLAALSALLAAGTAVPAEDLVRPALDAALATPGGRVELVELGAATPRGCTGHSAEVPRPVAASGRVAVQLRGLDARGEACEAWAWARVRVQAPALVTTRAVAEGEPLAASTAAVARELLPGRPLLSELPEGAVAERALAAGTLLDSSQLRLGPRPGQPVRVVLRAGALEISQDAKALPCRRGHACALLPTGRRVEGQLVAGRILLENP